MPYRLIVLTIKSPRKLSVINEPSGVDKYEYQSSSP